MRLYFQALALLLNEKITLITKESIIDGWIEDWHIDIPFRHLTFGSLAELMKFSDEPLVQIWSILAVHNLCRVNSKLRF